jgi:predicted phosphodiesterase
MQNKKIEEKFLKTIKEMKPDVVVLMGDVIDLESISPFTRKEKDFLLSDEILATERYLKRVKDVSRDAEVYYLEGNHETRLAKYLERRADKLRDADQFQIENILGLDDLGIDWMAHNPRYGLKIDGVLYTHYLYEVRMRAIPGKLGVDCSIKAGQSVCVGHGHELSATYHTVGTKRTLGVMTGCMCTTQAGREYVNFPKWVPGFVIMTDGYPTLVTL